MTRPYPSPPHLVAGLATEGEGGDATAQLQSALRACGATGSDADWLAAPDGSPVLISALGEGRLEFVLSGELIGMPPGVDLDAEDIAAVAATREFLQHGFEASCQTVDPLYAGVAFEWRIPSPGGLADEGVWLPGDLYWSSTLEADVALREDLESIFGGTAEDYAHGRLLSAGGLLSPSAPTPARPLQAGRAAALRFKRALDQLR